MHAHFLDNGFIGAALKNLYGKPLVVTAHGGEVYDLAFRNKWYRTLYCHVLNKADHVIAVSQFIEEKLLSLGVSPNKLSVISNGYDDKLFKPFSTIAARKKLGLPLNKKILLSIGNLVDDKGHTHLIDAMRLVLKERNDVILVIVGSGSLKEPLKKKTRELGLDGKILLVGQKKHEEIPVWMNACDVFVLPSLCESFGVVIIEALACGKPVVATRVGGIPEIITDKDFGILVEPACPLPLSEGLLDALERKWVHSKIALYAKKYSWTSVVQNILKVYSDVLTTSDEHILT
jgi:glycosyltransferase involved in cell wall biosynthesis